MYVNGEVEQRIRTLQKCGPTQLLCIYFSSCKLERPGCGLGVYRELLLIEQSQVAWWSRHNNDETSLRHSTATVRVQHVRLWLSTKCERLRRKAAYSRCHAGVEDEKPEFHGFLRKL